MPELTYRYRLYPTPQQMEDIRRTCNAARFLYNQLLTDCTKHYRETRSWMKIDSSPYKALSFMLNIDPGALQWAENSLRTAYHRFFHAERTLPDQYRPESLVRTKKDPEYQLMDTDLLHYPRFKRKKTSKTSYTTCLPNLEVQNGRIHLPRIGRVKIKLHRPIPENAEQISCTVLKKPCGHYYLLICLKLPEIKKKTDLQKPLGVAFVPGKLAVRSDDEPVLFRHQDAELRKRINRAYKALCRRTPGSKGYEEMRLHIARLHEYRVNQRRDDLHKIARQITNAADAIYVQQPDVRAHLKTLGDNKAAKAKLLDESRWRCSEFIQYKTRLEGKKFWSVVQGFPIYSLCSACDHWQKEAGMNEMWKCPACGLELNLHTNAARNLENLGAKYIRETTAQKK